MTADSPAMPTLFIPHGGGPCFFMDWSPADTWTKMAEWLRGLAETLPERPKAIVVISGHWEERQVGENGGGVDVELEAPVGLPGNGLGSRGGGVDRVGAYPKRCDSVASIRFP